VYVPYAAGEYRVCLYHAPLAPGGDIDCLPWTTLEHAAAYLGAILSGQVHHETQIGALLQIERRSIAQPHLRHRPVCVYRYTLTAARTATWNEEYCMPGLLGLGEISEVPGRPTGFPPEPGDRPTPQTDVNLQGASSWWAARTDGEKIAVATSGLILGGAILRALLR
jgi:hypothetical protein